MNPFIAPPNLLSAMLFRSSQDPFLSPGLHLRIFAGASASFPVSPFLLYSTKGSGIAGDATSVVLGRYPGERFPTGSIRTFGQTPVRMEFLAQQGSIDAMTMLDGSKVLATRSQGPWVFSLPAWSYARIAGNAAGLISRTLNAPDTIPDVGSLGIPIRPGLALPQAPAQPRPWYIGAELVDEKNRRVGEGAPRTWGPREQWVFSRFELTNGDLVPRAAPANIVSPTPGKEAEEERARVAYLLKDDPRLSDMVEQMLGDNTAPWDQAHEVQPDQIPTAQYNPLQLLQLGMADYGLARHFGYARSWLPGAILRDDDDLLAIAAFIAFDPKRVPQSDEGMLGHTVSNFRPPQKAHNLEQELLRRIAEDGFSRDPEGDLARVRQVASGLGLMVAPFITYTAAVAPYDAPTLPAGRTLRRQWSLPTGSAPSDRYSAVFAFRDAPMSMLALLQRQDDNGWTLRTGSSRDDEDEGYKEWLKPQVLGRESETASRSKESNFKTNDTAIAALLSDQSIPAGAATTYQALAADAFGRFGAASQFSAGPPDRPRPSAPRLSYRYDPVTPRPTGEADASPGKLRISAKFDADKDHLPVADEIGVPSVASSPRGALQIDRLELSLSGTLHRLGTPPEVTEPLPSLGPFILTRENPAFEIQLPALPPMGKANFTLKGAFVDTAGQRSDDAALNDPTPAGVVTFSTTDGRAPPNLTTGVGLLWTTRPSPAPTVSIDLSWPAPVGAYYHVYLGDERTLLSGQVEADRGASRGARGAHLCETATRHDKTKYQRLTVKPLSATTTTVSYPLELPRTLESVQVVRVVPIGPDGAEQPFGDCASVPIAVPSSHRAPPPLLTGTVDAQTGEPTLKVIADGLNIDELQAEQQGLFRVGAQGAELPTFRLRCSNGRVSHPLYAPVVQQAGSDDGSLSLELKSERVGPPAVAEDTTKYWFEAQVRVNALEPYVRHVFWAETRLPPERCLPAGVEKVSSGIKPMHPESDQSAPRLWGDLSAALVLMHTPPAKPLAQGDVTAQIVSNGPPRVKLNVTLANPPKISGKAVGPYRLAAWYRWGDRALAPVLDETGASLDGRWPDAANLPAFFTDLAPAAGMQLTFHVCLIDPVGRMGEVTTLAT